MPEELHPVPTLEEVEAEIEAEWEEDRRRALRAQARQRVSQHDTVRRQQQRDRRVAERAEAERAERAKEAAKAWRKVYGRKIAKALDPWTRYAIVDIDGKVFACSPDRAEAVRIASRDSRGIRRDDIASDVLGAELTKHVRSLDGVDPSDEELAELTGAREAREREAHRRQVEKRERERREDRERRDFGVTISDVPDEAEDERATAGAGASRRPRHGP